MAGQPDVLAVLKLHYLRWILFDINGETYFNTWAFSTPTSTNTPRMQWHLCGNRHQHRFRKSRRLSEGLEDERRRRSSSSSATIICPSFLEYAEYPYVSADEIKKALKLKAAFSDMLDQMQ